jgi:hypothetical protein
VFTDPPVLIFANQPIMSRVLCSFCLFFKIPFLSSFGPPNASLSC